MIITSAVFLKSSTSISKLPVASMPEFCFIGRSNVGKSSLINMLTGRSKLAKTSGEPGKTRTINHFLINDSWYIADLPGYGYARVPLKTREGWMKIITEYISKRTNLVSLFVLIDSRHKPQQSDMKFMEWLGINQIAFARIFTKCDKLKALDLERSVHNYDSEMLKIWESLPPTFMTSTVKSTGKDEILSYIEKSINNFKKEK
jgi:GTP-binding protein